MKTAKIKPTNRLETNGHGAASALPAATISIPKLRVRTIEVKIVSKSPLIVHAWSEKAVRMMLDKQMGVSSAGRQKKNPVEDFKGSLYYLPNKAGFGIPAPAFKAAMVGAANDVDMVMTEVRRAIHVSSYYVPIIADPLPEELWSEDDREYAKQIKFEHSFGCSMRRDMVRLDSGVADVRFRGSWPVWKCALQIEYNEAVVSAEQVVNLVNAAGYGSGVCEWRPSSPKNRSGEFGRFEV